MKRLTQWEDRHLRLVVAAQLIVLIGAWVLAITSNGAFYLPAGVWTVGMIMDWVNRATGHRGGLPNQAAAPELLRRARERRNKRG